MDTIPVVAIIFLDTVKHLFCEAFYDMPPHLPSTTDMLLCTPTQLFHTCIIASRAKNHHPLFLCLFFPTKSCVFSEQGVGLVHVYILRPGPTKDVFE